MTSYRLKKITFNGREVPVVVQNENGPCPLLAIANTLLLRGMLTIAVNSPDISSDRLMQMVAEYLLDSNKVEDESPHAANLQKNLGDVISALPKLATGVDVNPSFDTFRGFEFTDEVAIFDMFNISLVHGWLVDPTHVNKGLRDFTYNQLVGKLIAILGDETPAHILSTHSSFKASSKREFSQSLENISVPEDPPLIQLDSEELGPLNTEANSPLDAPLEELTPAEKHESEDIPTPPESSCAVESVLGLLEDHREDNNSAQATVSGKDEITVQPTIDSQAGDNGISEPAVPGNSSNLAANNPVLEERMKSNEFSIRAQQWLDETSNQLTDYGLKCLNEGLQEEQLAVFFRNNHFNTIYKRSEGLYLLVTDLGYLSEPGVVWEKLDDVDGNTQMMTDAFAPYVRSDHVNSTEDDVDLHRALAASLALDPDGNPDGRTPVDGSNAVLLHQNIQQPPVSNSDADLALALQLHEEELQRHEEMVQEAALEAAQQQQSTQQTTAAHGQQNYSRRPHGAVSETNRSRQPRQQNMERYQEVREPTGFEKFSRSIKQFFTSKK